MELRPESPWVLERIAIGGITRLQEGVTTIGRSPACTITVASDYVSRTHAELQVAPGSEDIQIRDLGSTNGIFVNDQLYNRAICRLQVGDRIGVGVSVDDDQVTVDGKYPMFVLRRTPLVEVNNVLNESVAILAQNDEKMDAEESIPLYPAAPNREALPPGVQLGMPDNEYDEDDDEDDFVQPQGILEFENGITAPTPSSSAAVDLPNRNTVSENIRSIFGDLNSELLSRLSKDAREIAEASTSKHISAVGARMDVICISSDDECDVAQRKNNKSPELFCDSFSKEEELKNAENRNELVAQITPKNNKSLELFCDSFSKEEDLKNAENEKELVADISPKNLPVDITMIKQENVTLFKVDDVDENEEEELYFTQRLLDDLREKSPDSDIEIIDKFKFDFGGASIKQEKYSDDIINLDCDDEDEHDEALDAKVKDWSIKLLSQSFTNNSNLSQVFENDIGNAPAATTEGIFINIDDDDDDEAADKPESDKPIEIPNAVVTSPIAHSSSDRKYDKQKKEVSVHKVIEDASQSSLVKQYKQSSNNKFLDSSSSEDESNVQEPVNTKKPKAISSLTNHERQEVHPRKRSITDETPQKKPRLSSGSEENEKEGKDDVGAPRVHRQNSSSMRTPSKESSERREPKTIRGPPQIITAPQLPNGRGKLRGVSAAQHRCIERLTTQSIQKELNRKWKEKPSIARRKEQAKCKAMKEDRKQKLKELADKQSSDVTNTTGKASSRKKIQERGISKNPKVKVTPVNRGAFLTEDTPSGNIKSYRIPKTKFSRSSSTSSEPASIPQPSTSKTTKSETRSTKAIDKRKSTTEAVTNFSQELLKADAILRNTSKQSNSNACRNRGKSVDAAIDKKERAPPRPSNKKITFDGMVQHFKETSRLQELQEKLARTSCLKSQIAGQKKKKTVRFNDVPKIIFIDSISSATRKAFQKQPLTLGERTSFISTKFPTVDHTEELLSDVLSWSQLWLNDKRPGFNMDLFDDMMLPMPNIFQSFDHYKKILFPLMKLEYLSHLLKHMKRYASTPGYKIRFDYLTHNKDRDLMSAKCSPNIKQSELGLGHLVLIDIVGASATNQCFGYIRNIRKTDCYWIEIDVPQKAINSEDLKAAKQITVRRIMEAMSVVFGSLNAVYQLEKTPLFQLILNPLGLLKVKSHSRPAIQYKGYNPLNDEQKEILLKTYDKTIEEYNPNITLIKGPPGTGKSRLITNLALQILYGHEVRSLDKKILICAQSNLAVDVIAQQLYAIQKKLSPRAQRYEVIRFGQDTRVHRDVEDITVTKLIERDQKARLQARTGSHEQTTICDNLKNEILKLEAKVAELLKENLQDVRQDELIQMKKSLALKKSIQSQTLRPEEKKRLTKLYLGNANIICTTLSSCVNLSQYTQYFDVCIIDEATQCIEPYAIMPLRFGVSSLIMVGDTQQLPATVLSQKAKDYGLGTSLFTRIQNCLENNDGGEPSPILSLHTQYRMHPEICKWPNMYFYQDQLLNSPITAEFKSNIKPFSILNLEYRQNEQCNNGQISNSLEAEFVEKLVKTLNLYIPNKYFSYGVITPYSKHRENLEVMIKRSGLPNIMVNTIDSYQGIEKDVIIISNARTQGVGFLADYQRLNVALTRPKKCLILCGKFTNLESVPSWASLLANARERGLFHDISPADALDIDNNVIRKIKIKP